MKRGIGAAIFAFMGVMFCESAVFAATSGDIGINFVWPENAVSYYRINQGLFAYPADGSDAVSDLSAPYWSDDSAAAAANNTAALYPYGITWSDIDTAVQVWKVDNFSTSSRPTARLARLNIDARGPTVSALYYWQQNEALYNFQTTRFEYYDTALAYVDAPAGSEDQGVSTAAVEAGHEYPLYRDKSPYVKPVTTADTMDMIVISIWSKSGNPNWDGGTIISVPDDGTTSSGDNDGEDSNGGGTIISVPDDGTISIPDDSGGGDSGGEIPSVNLGCDAGLLPGAALAALLVSIAGRKKRR